MAIRCRRSREVAARTVVEDWGSLTWLASGKVGNSDCLTLGRVVISAGRSNPRHCHPNCEEVLYLLAGRLRHTLGAKTFLLESGDTLSIPAGQFHNATAVGPGDADMIVAYSSGERGFQLEA